MALKNQEYHVEACNKRYLYTPSKAQETITYTCSSYNIFKLPYYTSSPSFADKYEEGDNSGLVLLFDMGGGLYTIYLML